MRQIQIPCNFMPRPYQQELYAALDGGKRRAFLRWHRRAGKDKACWCYMIKKAVEVAGNYYYVFPTAAQGRKALWETTDNEGNAAVDHIPRELNANINSQEMRVIVPTVSGQRSIIRIIGLDKNKDGIRGVSCKGAVFSEFAYQDPDAYKTLMPSLRESKGWCIFNSTPEGNNHFWDMEQSIKDSDNWFFSHLQGIWPDEPNYSGIYTPEEMIEIQAEEGYTDEDMEREYGACYNAGAKGSIYSDHIKKSRAEGRVNQYPYDSNYAVHTFWDLGYNDPTSIWFVQYIGSQIRFIDYWEGEKKEIPEIVNEVLYSKGYQYIEHHLPHDAENNYGLIVTKKDLLQQSLESYGLKSHVSVVPKLSVQEGINAVQSRFSMYHFNAGLCGEALETLALYHKRWDSKRRIFIKEPVHDWTSHCADALRTEALAAEADYLYESKAQKNTTKIARTFDLFD